MPRSGQEMPLGNRWSGLRRNIGAHLLEESQSPETYDAMQSGNKVGVLGPRLGRKKLYATTNNILNVGGLNVPWGRFRCVAEDSAVADSAVWHLIAVPWPAPAAGASAQTWDRIIFSNLTATLSNGVGTANSAGYSVGTFDLSQYAAIAIRPDATTQITATDTAFGSSAPAFSGEAHVRLQGLIGGVWTTLVTWRIRGDAGTNDSSLIEEFQTTPTLSGSLTQIRVQVQIDADSGGLADVTAHLYGSIFLLRGSEKSSVTVP